MKNIMLFIIDVLVWAFLAVLTVWVIVCGMFVRSESQLAAESYEVRI